ncbi:MAG: response regulator [Tannerella sp.]|jgi:signal transduction histidine kinase/ligand-binding sensor domain-containing protein/DNA-binding response OmpR family regulator|nr:response regulator [Tannerella sp.]
MKSLLVILILFISITSYSQPYSISRLGIEQGLSNNYVVSITQDKDGFLWFATEEGLNKFDGTRFINYYKHTNSISANELNYIYADPDKPVIWIATQRAGLNAYDYEKNTLKVYLHDDNNPYSIITNDVTSIKPSADGNLWISTYYLGFELFDKEKETFTHYNTSHFPELLSDNIWNILDDHNGNLYIGHVQQGMSILSVKDKQIKRFKHDPDDPNSIPGNDVRCIYKDKNNNMWVGTDKGVSLFDSETNKFTTLRGNDDLSSSTVFDIRQMDDNKLWITTEFNGIFIIDLKQHFFKSTDKINLQHIVAGYTKYNLSYTTVRSVFQDSFNNIWIGTYGGGINFIGHTKPFFNTYDYSPASDDINSLNNKAVLSLCFDVNERLWVGTDGGGINVLDKGKRTAIYNKENGNLSHNSITTMFKDSKNNIWIGTFFSGIDLYNHKTNTFNSIQINNARNQDVRCFFEDKHGFIWVGTNTGIYIIDADSHETIRHYSSQDHLLPENLVRSINQDNNGCIWVGTFGQGIAVYTSEMKEIIRLNEQNEFCSNMINHTFKDSYHNMWMASGEGLVCFPNSDPSKYKIFQRNDGLHNTFIRAIAEDADGNIWFSTNAGISCYLKDSDQFRNYNYFDKTPMGSFTNASVTSYNGTIYFGSINGVRYFDPVSVLNSKETPPVIITEMNIYEKQTALENSHDINYFGKDNKIKLNYKQNTFTITFNIQDYSLAHQVDYSYRLKGLDDSWYAVHNNNVVFRNIPPGRYEFQVRSRIRNLEWAENNSSLFIQIMPPVWLSWYAKVFYLIFIISIVLYLSYLYRKRVKLQSFYEMEKKNYEQEQELNNERLRFYTNIAHELRTPLTLILGPLEDLQKDTQLQPKQSRKIGVVRQSAIRLLNLINQILEFRKTETQNKKLVVSKGNIATLVKEIGLNYKELIVKPDIEFSITTEQDDMVLYFDKEIVTIILDNLISNAIKYTDKGSIKLELYTYEKDSLAYTEIKVEDTGSGIPADEQSKIFDRYYQAKRNKYVSGTGIGLALVKNLITLHEGDIRVDSKPDEGSCFYFSLLTHNTYPNALHDVPDNNQEKTATEDLPEISEAAGRPILLVVEDNSDIQNYISESFSGLFEVITANEGEEGCSKAFSYIPDIIVSDIMMPGMNGIELCKRIKEDVRTSHIPVILLTAKDSISDKEEGYTSGADSYLTKPFSATLLHSRINNLLENRKKIADRLRNNIHTKDKSHLLKESINQIDDEFIQNITRIIEENMEIDKIDIAYLSEKLFMSSSTLYRKMKALTGISANEFIRKIKMNKAEQLLLQGKYNISEIAYKVGINSPVYFRQCFKEEFGLTPSEYIKELNR